MSKSTYFSPWTLSPHKSSMSLKDYPHKESISFIVVTRYAPKSTYSPKFDNNMVEMSDKVLSEAVDEMMGLGDEMMMLFGGVNETEE